MTCDLALIITISDTSKNQPKWIDTDDLINLSRLIVYLGTIFPCKVDTWPVKSVAWRTETTKQDQFYTLNSKMSIFVLFFLNVRANGTTNTKSFKIL